jgi:hypothetical protein
MTEAEIIREIKFQESKLSGDFVHDLTVKDRIHNLKMKLNGTKPMNQEIDCVNCGS